MTLDDIKKIYADLLIAQYRNRTRARATIGLLAGEATCDGLLLLEQNCFDLDTALGAQLDIIGRIVGVPRNIYGLDLSHTYWEMTGYSGTPTGIDMQRYNDAIIGPELMLRYRSTATYTMSDFEMRALIKLKIVYNTARETLKDFMESLYAAFSGGITIVDNFDVTITYKVDSQYTTMMTIASYLGIIPKPMGVALTIEQIGGDQVYNDSEAQVKNDGEALVKVGNDGG